MNLKKKGLSLIVLGITIIVMVILAGTVIVSLQKGNPIDQAKLAVLKTNVSQILEETNMFVISNYDKETKKFDYPIKEALTDAEIEKLPIVLKESLARDQEIFTPEGLPDIFNINKEKKLAFWLDKEKISSAKAFKQKIILSITKSGGIEIYFDKPEVVLDVEYYRLEEILFGVIITPQFVTSETNTYKIYPNGTLTAIGQKNNTIPDTKEDQNTKDKLNENPVKPLVEGGKDFFGYNAQFTIKDGKVYVLGKNNKGRFGLGHSLNVLTPTEIPGITNAVRVIPNLYSTFIITTDGLYAAGYHGNYFLGIGINPNTEVHEFKKVPLPEGVSANEIENIYTTHADSPSIMIVKKQGETFKRMYKTKVNEGIFKECNFGELIGNANLKEYKYRYYYDIYLTDDGTIYINVRGKINFVANGVKEIGLGDSGIYTNGGLLYKNNDDSLHFVNITVNGNNPITKKFVDLDYPGPDKTPSKYKLISSNRILYTNGNDIKVYLYDENTEKLKLEFDNKVNDKFQIEDVKEEYATRIIKVNGGHFISGSGPDINDIIYNKSYAQLEQRKVYDKTRFLNLTKLNQVTHDLNIDLIDLNYKFYKDYGKNKVGDEISKVVRTSLYEAILYRNGNVIVTGENLAKGKAQLNNVKDIATTGSQNIIALTRDNKIFWLGNLGNTAPFDETSNVKNHFQREFVEVSSNKIPKTDDEGKPLNFVKIAGVEASTFLLSSTGDLYSLGKAQKNQSYNGFGMTNSKNTYTKLECFDDRVVDLKTFYSAYETIGGYVLVTLANGNVYAWGHNTKGQFGKGVNTNFELGGWYYKPELLQLDDIINTGVGEGFALYQQSDGTVYGAGTNEYGQLGTGNINSAINEFVKSTELSKNISK